MGTGSLIPADGIAENNPVLCICSGRIDEPFGISDTFSGNQDAFGIHA